MEAGLFFSRTFAPESITQPDCPDSHDSFHLQWYLDNYLDKMSTWKHDHSFHGRLHRNLSSGPVVRIHTILFISIDLGKYPVSTRRGAPVTGIVQRVSTHSRRFLRCFLFRSKYMTFISAFHWHFRAPVGGNMGQKPGQPGHHYGSFYEVGFSRISANGAIIGRIFHRN